jgi:acyl dehydratase
MTIDPQPQETAFTPAAPRTVDVGDLDGLVGQQFGYSSWHEITQEDVSEFAALTGDGQWIHLDPERAAAGPYGATVAHGFFTLARFTGLLRELLEVEGVRTTLNYGLNRVRFPAPARVGSRIRMGLTIIEVERVAGAGVQVVYGASFEIDGQAKPTCVAEVVFRYYPTAPPTWPRAT